MDGYFSHSIKFEGFEKSLTLKKLPHYLYVVSCKF